jgi:RpiB/LacA/LacB family sugar-phosphate isomerase
MRIAIGCDDTGFPLKEQVSAALEASGHDLLDLGTFSTDPVDHPDYARAVGQAVLRGFVDAGMLICGSGAGASIAANKIRGIRASLCHDPEAARLAREEDDANVLCLGAREVDPIRAVAIAMAWLGASFSGEERFARKISKIALLEEGLPAAWKAPPRPAAISPAARPPARETPVEAAPRPLPRMPAEAPITSPQPPVPRMPVEAPAAPPPRPVPRMPLEAPAAPPPRPAPRMPIELPSEPGAGGMIRVDDYGSGDASPGTPRPVDEIFKLPAVQETLDALEAQDFLDRLWVKDASLWKGEAPAIRNRLGWLTSPTIMRGHTDDIKTFADEIRRLQFTHVVVLGMGGASLCGEVFNLAFGSKMGFPDLVLLDSTDPATVKQTFERLNLSRTLFIVASKSGDTLETLAFYEYFRGQVEASSVPRAGIHFVAITDPGRPLDKIASETGFRRTFLNPASIGGRYSALSFFGLVPAALMGIDIKALLDRAHAMVEACGNAVSARDNAAVRLGGALAGLAKVGRDKVTLVLSRQLRALGPWIEELLAESLGKDGKGLVPVDDEPLGSPAVYGDDRVFVAITLDGDDSSELHLNALEDAGHPVIRIPLKDHLEVGAEFFRWELATAAAGVALGVNPFDEPDIVRGRETTAALLSSWKKSRRLPEWPVDVAEGGLALLTNSGTKFASVSQGLQAFLGQAGPGDYIAILAYLAPTAENWGRLQELRTLLRDRLRVATTVGFGPRYLHSTGQLHKGGRANGLFLQLTGEDKDDMAIPGSGYGFATLKAAQALGDLQTLRDAGRRVVRVHLTGKQPQALEQLVQVAQRAVKKG